MESITITVDNEEKAKMLSELLQALDFVKDVELNRANQPQISEENGEMADFFSLAGLWQERQININDIRQQAWPKRQ
ncbi:MAG: hypothetical protein GY796_14805 [Chloroflexi bacterium]|nr:hypothetical protein [Chloroflexota bacterium]